MQNLRPSDWVVIAFGVVGIVKWLCEMWTAAQVRHDLHDEGLEQRVNRYRTDFLTHKAEVETDAKWIKEGIANLTRKVDNLSSQIKLAASGGNNKFFEVGKEDK